MTEVQIVDVTVAEAPYLVDAFVIEHGPSGELDFSDDTQTMFLLIF